MSRTTARDTAITENASVITRNSASMSKSSGKGLRLSVNYIGPKIKVEKAVTNCALYTAIGGTLPVNEYKASKNDVVRAALVLLSGR